MLWRNQVKAAAFGLALLGLNGPAAQAEQLNAGAVLNNMDASDRFTYLAGVIEGLSYARFLEDGKDRTGLRCLIGWFYDDPQNRRKLDAAFARYPDQSTAAIVLALTKRDCGG